jgi:hypothetical protein
MRAAVSSNARQPRDEPYFVADYAGGRLPFIPLTVPLAEARRLFMTDFSDPSSVRVFAKSLHWLAAGWMASVTWLWLAVLRQHVLRLGVVPDDFGASTIAVGLMSAILIEATAMALVRWTGRAPRPALERREWRIAFWWSFFPNLLLVLTALLMISGGP